MSRSDWSRNLIDIFYESYIHNASYAIHHQNANDWPMKWSGLYKAEQSVQVDLLEARKMGQRKDQSDFDKLQIVTDDWLRAFP